MPEPITTPAECAHDGGTVDDKRFCDEFPRVLCIECGAQIEAGQ